MSHQVERGSVLVCCIVIYTVICVASYRFYETCRKEFSKVGCTFILHSNFIVIHTVIWVASYRSQATCRKGFSKVGCTFVLHNNFIVIYTVICVASYHFDETRRKGFSKVGCTFILHSNLSGVTFLKYLDIARDFSKVSIPAVEYSKISSELTFEKYLARSKRARYVSTCVFGSTLLPLEVCCVCCSELLCVVECVAVCCSAVRVYVCLR